MLKLLATIVELARRLLSPRSPRYLEITNTRFLLVSEFSNRIKRR